MNSSISPIRLERSPQTTPPRMNTRKYKQARLNSTPVAARRLFETSSPVASPSQAASPSQSVSPSQAASPSPQREIRKSKRKVPMRTLKNKLSSMTSLNINKLPDDLSEDDFSPRDITREDIQKMIDPITFEIISNPVMINNDDRYTFDLNSITKWVKKNGTNPLNRDITTIRDITPNIARRQLIERAIRQYIRLGGKYKRRHNKKKTNKKKRTKKYNK